MPGLLAIAILLCTAPCSYLAVAAPSDEKPNIVIFFADDVSYNIMQVSANGGQVVIIIFTAMA